MYTHTYLQWILIKPRIYRSYQQLYLRLFLPLFGKITTRWKTRNYLVFTWYSLGFYLVFTWYLLRFYLVFTRNLLEIYLELLSITWYLLGIYLVFTWYLLRIWLVYSLLISLAHILIWYIWPKISQNSQ